MTRKYRCNKCGRIVQMVHNPEKILLYADLEHMCENTDKAPFPLMCTGRLIPFEIKPAPCKDCD